MIVLKLGGSVLTVKDTPETVDNDALDRAAAAVASTNESIVLVHGGGSFGHHYAARYDVTESAGTQDGTAVRDIHGAMRRLNELVVDALAAYDAPAVPIAPLSMACRDESGSLTVTPEAVRVLRSEKFLPVLHGDVIGHHSRGTTVLSGDELVVELAHALTADRVGLCSTVPGVLDENGEVITEIESDADIPNSLGGSDATDVTGGMAGKVRRLQELDAPASVFGLSALESFLDGDSPGTTVR